MIRPKQTAFVHSAPGRFLHFWSFCLLAAAGVCRADGPVVYMVDYFEIGGQRFIHWRYNEGVPPPTGVIVRDGRGESLGRVDYPADRFVVDASIEAERLRVAPVMQTGEQGEGVAVDLEDSWTRLRAPRLSRIRITKQDGAAHFVEGETGGAFVVKGVNYIRLRHGDHATFDAATQTTAAHYDSLDSETLMRTLKRNGYNCVRVFIIGRSSGNPGIAGDYDRTEGLYGPYMENVLDFLRRARVYGIYVLPTFGDGELPRNRYWRGRVQGVPGGENAVYLTAAGIEAKKAYVTSFLGFIKEHEPELLKALLGVQMQNELSLNGDAWPFTVREGKLQMADGRTYDMADREERQALMDNGINHYHRTLAAAVKEIDRDLLVTEGIFTLRAVGKSVDSHKGVYPRSSGDRRYPPTVPVLARGNLDFIDVHFYHTRKNEAIEDGFQRDMQSVLLDSATMASISKTTPIILGEFGSFRGVEETLESAARNILRTRDAALEYGMAGTMIWTFDCFEQRALRPVMEDGGALLERLGAGR